MVHPSQGQVSRGRAGRFEIMSLPVQALFFDVFGTLVDWRAGIAREAEAVLPRFGVSDLAEETLQDLNLAWHRLDAWPDVAPGFARLRRRFLLAPVSNGNISLMVDLARRNGLPWDAILGAEIAGDYKPKPRVYLAACAAFDLDPGECMMVAAHSRDLAAASSCGL